MKTWPRSEVQMLTAEREKKIRLGEFPENELRQVVGQLLAEIDRLREKLSMAASDLKMVQELHVEAVDERTKRQLELHKMDEKLAVAVKQIEACLTYDP